MVKLLQLSTLQLNFRSDGNISPTDELISTDTSTNYGNRKKYLIKNGVGRNIIIDNLINKVR